MLFHTSRQNRKRVKKSFTLFMAAESNEVCSAGSSENPLHRSFLLTGFSALSISRQTVHAILHCFGFTGVYISKYADCLLPRPWYHGKSGYIVICKLIKVKHNFFFYVEWFSEIGVRCRWFLRTRWCPSVWWGRV